MVLNQRVRAPRRCYSKNLKGHEVSDGEETEEMFL